MPRGKDFLHPETDYPSPQKLDQLASVALGTAHFLDKVMTPGFAKGKAQFFCNNTKIDTVGAEFERHTVGFMLAHEAIAGNEVDDYMTHEGVVVPTWRFRIKDTYFSDPTGNRGIRNEYHFAWNEDEVLRSTKETQLLPVSAKTMSLQALEYWLKNNPVKTEFLAEEMQVRHFGNDEFDELAGEMEQYFTSLKLR